MSWGTTFNKELYINRKIFNSIYEVEDFIEDRRLYLGTLKQELTILAAGNPKDLVGEEWKEEVATGLSHKLNDLFNEIEETYRELVDLEYYKEYLEENNIIHIKRDKDDPASTDHTEEAESKESKTSKSRIPHFPPGEGEDL